MEGGITEVESFLLLWTIAGPDVCRVIKEYETISMTDRQIYPNHHEETLYTQKGFETDILSLI